MRLVIALFTVFAVMVAALVVLSGVALGLYVTFCWCLTMGPLALWAFWIVVAAAVCTGWCWLQADVWAGLV